MPLRFLPLFLPPPGPKGLAWRGRSESNIPAPLGAIVLYSVASTPITGPVGAIVAVSAALGAVALHVKGVVEAVGAATHTDVSQGTKALDATGNGGGLVATVASGGNLEVGKTAAVLTDVATIATDPKNTFMNPVLAIDAARTASDAYDLMQEGHKGVERKVERGEMDSGQQPKDDENSGKK